MASAAAEVPPSRDAVARLRLDRPPGNRLSLDLLERLAEDVRAVAADPRWRCALLTADGPDFSHGADLRDPGLAMKVAGGPEERRALAELGQQLIDDWAALPIPTVASARGAIVGGGACLFTVSDFKFAAPDAYLRLPEVDLGLHLSWGIIPRLAREYGAPAARRLALGGERMDIADLPPGAVSIVTGAPVDDAAESFAARLAAKPGPAVRAIVEVFRLLDASDRGATATDPRRFAETVASPEFAEAIGAWLSGQD